MGKLLGGGAPKVDTSAQDAQIASQKVEAENLTKQENAKKRALIGRNSGKRSLMTGLETGVDGLRKTLG